MQAFPRDAEGFPQRPHEPDGLGYNVTEDEHELIPSSQLAPDSPLPPRVTIAAPQPRNPGWIPPRSFIADRMWVTALPQELTDRQQEMNRHQARQQIIHLTRYDDAIFMEADFDLSLQERLAWFWHWARQVTDYATLRCVLPYPYYASLVAHVFYIGAEEVPWAHRQTALLRRAHEANGARSASNLSRDPSSPPSGPPTSHQPPPLVRPASGPAPPHAGGRHAPDASAGAGASSNSGQQRPRLPAAPVQPPSSTAVAVLPITAASGTSPGAAIPADDSSVTLSGEESDDACVQEGPTEGKGPVVPSSIADDFDNFDDATTESGSDFIVSPAPRLASSATASGAALTDGKSNNTTSEAGASSSSAPRASGTEGGTAACSAARSGSPSTWDHIALQRQRELPPGVFNSIPKPGRINSLTGKPMYPPPGGYGFPGKASRLHVTVKRGGYFDQAFRPVDTAPEGSGRFRADPSPLTDTQTSEEAGNSAVDSVMGKGKSAQRTAKRAIGDTENVGPSGPGNSAKRHVPSR